VSHLKSSAAQTEQRSSDLEDTVAKLKAEVGKRDDESRLRESNTHRLRHESQAAAAELSSCKQRIQSLEASLQDAQERLLVASADAGSREQELEQELQIFKERAREEVCVCMHAVYAFCEFTDLIGKGRARV
jgi:molecular chaperone GrpE (heat shock protein)